MPLERVRLRPLPQHACTSGRGTTVKTVYMNLRVRSQLLPQRGCYYGTVTTVPLCDTSPLPRRRMELHAAVLRKGVRSEVCCCAYMPFELSVKFQENEENVLGLWVCSFLGCLKKFPCLRLDPTVLYIVLFPDFSHVVCDRLSVDIMNDRFTLISKLISIVVRLLQIFRCDAFRC